MYKRGDVLIAVGILSAVAFVWSLVFKSKSEPIPLKDFLGLLPTVISLVGASKEKKKKSKPKKAKSFHLAPSFESGLYGGLIGGAFAGLIIGIAYYVEAISSGDPISLGNIPQVFIYASLVGTVTGAFSQLSILWFRYAAAEKQYSKLLFNEVSGGLLGGAVGGILVGALGGWFFGLRETAPVSITLLVGGAAFGGICAAVGALLYDYKGRLRNLLRSLVISVAITIFLAALTISMSEVLGFTPAWFETWKTPLDVIKAGAILGLLIGIMLGLQIGVSLWLYRLSDTKVESVG